MVVERCKQAMSIIIAAGYLNEEVSDVAAALAAHEILAQWVP